MRLALHLAFEVLFGAALATTACGGSSSTDFTTGAPRGESGGDGSAGLAGRGGTSSGGNSGTGNAGSGGTTAGTNPGGSAGSGAGGSGAGASARGGAGGSAGTGGAGTGGGATGGGDTGGTTGGASGSGGTGAGTGGSCNFGCPAIACQQVVALTVEPDASASTAVIQALQATGVGVDVTCAAAGSTPCTWRCYSKEYTVPPGDYSVTLTAPGYAPKTIDFTVAPQTNCGCCGCGCTVGAQQTVELTPNSTLPSGGCCADLDNDNDNCGACGRKCPANLCQAGACTPYFGNCLFGGEDVQTQTTFQNCDGYCASVGQVCSASCGTNANEASEEWLDPTQNCYDMTQEPTVHGCGDAFEKLVNGALPQVACCCGDPPK